MLLTTASGGRAQDDDSAEVFFVIGQWTWKPLESFQKDVKLCQVGSVRSTAL